MLACHCQDSAQHLTSTQNPLEMNWYHSITVCNSRQFFLLAFWCFILRLQSWLANVNCVRTPCKEQPSQTRQVMVCLPFPQWPPDADSSQTGPCGCRHWREALCSETGPSRLGQCCINSTQHGLWIDCFVMTLMTFPATVQQNQSILHKLNTTWAVDRLVCNDFDCFPSYCPTESVNTS